MRRRIVLGVAAALAVVLGVLWHARPAAVAGREFERVLADLRARGEPTSLDEVVLPPLAPEDNGWTDLVAAVEWWSAHAPEGWRSTFVGPWNPSCLDPWWETSSPDQMRELDAFLGEMEPAYVLVDRAVGKTALRPPLELPDETGMRAMSYIPLLQRVLRLLDGAAHGASAEPARRRAVRAMAAIARRMDAHVTMIDDLVAGTALAQACLGLRAQLASRRVEPAAARADLDALLDVRWTDRRPAVAVHERAALCELMPHALDGTIAPAQPLTPRKMWKRLLAGKNPLASRGGGIEPSDLVADIQSLDIAASLTPSWSRAYDEQAAEGPGATSSRPSGAQVFARVIARSRQIDAQTRLARVALAACVHREVHGEWPTNSAALAALFGDGQVPIDPYAGEPFSWTIEDDALTIAARPWDVTTPARWDSAEVREDAGLIWRLAAPRSPDDRLTSYCTANDVAPRSLESVDVSLVPGASAYRYRVPAIEGSAERLNIPERHIVLLVPEAPGEIVELRLIERDGVSWRGIRNEQLLAAMRAAGTRVATSDEATAVMVDLVRIDHWLSSVLARPDPAKRLAAHAPYRSVPNSYGAAVPWIGGDDLGVRLDDDGYVVEILGGHIR